MTTAEPQREPLDLHREAVKKGIRLLSGGELVALVDEFSEAMTQDEREALADELDAKWRDNGRSA